MKDIRLSKNFKLSEFTRSQTAARHNICNQPSQKGIDNLQVLCEDCIEPIRELAGCPIYISSGYRCIQLNRLIGSRDTSQHIDGEAGDLTANVDNLKELAQEIADSDIIFDQLIYELDWIHVSYRKGANRRQVLTAKFTEKGVQYFEGIV